MVYDTVRGREVLLTEAGQTPLDSDAARPPGTWELVGGDWVRRFPSEPTPWYTGGCMAFDSSRGRTVVFGGPANSDTWEYDGSAWTQKTLATHPSARWHCAMAFDSARQKIVLFGGEDLASPPNQFGDTWEYDGTSWTLRSFSTAPSPRSLMSLSYDSDRSVTVLFGGKAFSGALLRDTWEYSGTKWTYKNANEGSNPPVRAAAGMTYDPVHKKTVLFGGYNPVSVYGDTWLWDGTRWTQVSPSGAPSARRGLTLAWDAQRQRIVGFGGGTASADGRNDTWSYDGTGWTQIAYSGQPPVRGNAGMAYDPVRDQLVLYGGQDPNYNLYYQDTWIYANGSWTQDATAGTTSSSHSTPLTFDPIGGLIEGFSGAPPNPSLPPPQDLHSFGEQTQTWSSIPQFGPPGRSGHTFVFSPSLNGSSVFAGLECCFVGSLFIDNDLWIYNAGSETWSNPTPAHIPPARWDHGLTYDSARGRLVLFGGHPTENGDFQALGDTWAYDGVDWFELSAASAPGARYGVSLAYDSARDRVVLFGDAPVAVTQTWEFDGANWIAMPTTRMPGEMRCWAPLAYDTKRHVSWLFGGSNCQGQGFSNDTWAYGPDPDGDGVVGGLDNCPNVANANQANADGDPAGDVCDCAPTDPTAWAMPQPVTGLLASGSGTTSLTWNDQAPATGTGAQYDMATGLLSDLHGAAGFGPATCLASRVAVPSASDGRVPTVADGFYYLVRSRNACGIGSYGATALDAASPCP